MKKKTILIIEDVGIIVELFMLSLDDRYNYKVTTTIRESLYVLEDSYKIHLVVLDYLLADGTAEELIEVIREKKIPYILATAWKPKEVFKKFNDAAWHLAKPFDIEDFIDAVNSSIQ